MRRWWKSKKALKKASKKASKKAPEKCRFLYFMSACDKIPTTVCLVGENSVGKGITG